MKFRFILPMLLFLLIVTESCKKNLEETPYSFLSEKTVFSNEAGLKQAILGVYGSWREDPIFDAFYQWALAECGQQYVTSGMVDNSYITPYYNFQETPSDLSITNVWPRYYQTIARANTVIAHAHEAVSDSNTANIYISEARFQRAYAYFMLVRDFGGVPLITEEISSISQTKQIFATQSSVQDVYNFIIQDLQFAETHLPPFWTGNDLGRISAGAAKALLGKVYLTGAGLPLKNPQYYQLAVNKLNEVVGSGEATYNFGLLPNFSDVFSNKNRKNKEVVFAWTNVWTSATPHNGIILPYFLFPTGLVGPTQTEYGLTPAFYNLYENTDTRRDFTVISNYLFQPGGDSIIYNTSIHHYVDKTTGGIVGNALIPYTGMAYGKFSRNPSPGGNGSPFTVDLIQLRFSDVLLCLAEALNETGQTTQAVPLLNRVRARANASQYPVGSQDEVRSEIRKERRLELTGEYTTVFDIRRWGTLKDEIAAMDPAQILNNALAPYSAKLELYPIPQAELDANPNLKQNPGW
jgi:starch-binding outer membrane protein, SusD/RagB family